MKGKAIILSAPSGAGKTTIVKHLLGLDLGLEFSISSCSRAPRANEKDGSDYYFISEPEFKKKIEKQEFLEWEQVYPGHFYGTLKSELARIWDKGKHVVFDVDVAGGINLKNIFGDNALAVFVKAPSLEILEQRLRDRATDPEEKIHTRIAKAESQMKFADRFDVILMNDALEDALNMAEEIVKSFLQKRKVDE
jgi:guanylate kinase